MVMVLIFFFKTISFGENPDMKLFNVRLGTYFVVTPESSCLVTSVSFLWFLEWVSFCRVTNSNVLGLAHRMREMGATSLVTHCLRSMVPIGAWRGKGESKRR